MSDDIEPRCVRADRCAEAELVDGVRVGAAVNTTAGLCVACERHTRLAVAELPVDYVGLSTVLGKGDGGAAEVVSSSRDLPVPIRLDVEALQRELVDVTSTWAEIVAAVCGLDWDTDQARHMRPGVLLDLSASLLAERTTVLLAVRDVEHLAWAPGEPRVRRAKCTGNHWTADGGPCRTPHPRVVFGDDRRESVTRDGVDGALALLELHHRARQVLGVDRRTYRLPEPCPVCGVPRLVHADGADVVDCRACGERMTWNSYRQRTDPLAGLENVS